MTYAGRTQVAPIKSRQEIERDLKRFGAEAFAFLEEGPRNAIQFRIKGRVIRIELMMPSSVQEQRSLWRAMALYVKARLVAIEAKIVTLEDAFLADVVTPDNHRMGDWLRPQINDMIRLGRMPQPLLPPPGGK